LNTLWIDPTRRRHLWTKTSPYFHFWNFFSNATDQWTQVLRVPNWAVAPDSPPIFGKVWGDQRGRKWCTQVAITRKQLNVFVHFPFICNQLKPRRYARLLRRSNTVSQKTSSRGHTAKTIATEWVISKGLSRCNIGPAPTTAASFGQFPIHSVPRQVFDEDLDVSADPELKKVPLSPASRSAQAKAATETFKGPSWQCVIGGQWNSALQVVKNADSLSALPDYRRTTSEKGKKSVDRGLVVRGVQVLWAS